MNSFYKIFVSFLLTCTLFLGMYWVAGQVIRQTRSIGGASQGNVAVLATTSTISVGPGTNKNMIFTENSSCTSRIISTGANAIMLSFSIATLPSTATTSSNPGPTVGFQQLASTTVTYDAGLFGCSAVSAYGYAASTTIQIAEYR